MELIRQIKEAETQAKQIVEQARSQANEMLEKAQQLMAEQTVLVRQERRELIDQASEAARQQGQAEADLLIATGRSQIRALEQRCTGKIDGCVLRVLEAIRNLSE